MIQQLIDFRRLSRRAMQVLALSVCMIIPSQVLADRIASVEVTGLDEAQTENALRFLSINAARERERVPESRIHYLFGIGDKEIQTSLQPYGYYNARIEAQLEQSPEGWRARYAVQRGEPIRVTDVDLVVAGAAAEDDSVKDAVSAFKPAVGQRLVHSRYEASRQSLLRLLADRGYFNARLLYARIEVNIEQQSAVINIRIDSGDRYRFGDVRFEGSQFGDEFMQRFVDFQPGDQYRQSELLALQRRLNDTEYFNYANVGPVSDELQDDRVPILVSVSPRPRHLYTAGLIIGTDSGAGVRAGVERRWVNQRGHKAKVDLNFTQRRQALALGYTIPRFERGIDTFALSLKDEDTDTSELRSAELIAARNFRAWSWNQMVSIRVLRENYTIAGLDDVSTLVYPSWRVSRTVADDDIFPRNGYSLSMEARAGSESLLSDVSFAQLRADARWIRGFGEDWRLLLRGELGATSTGIDDFEKLPVSLRFFAGGDRSVRGYAFQELGPLNDDGLVIGGRYLLAGSVEMERMIWGNWGVAAFVDAGNAFNDFGDYEISTGVGLGLRWRSPVGMLRVDVAQGLDGPGGGLRLHFMIGPQL